MALGQTSLLSSHDANYVLANPAALGRLDQRSVMLSLRGCLGSSETDDTFLAYDETMRSEVDYDFHLKLNGFAAALPMSLPSAPELHGGWGVGYQTVYDDGYSCTLDETYDGESYSKSDTDSHGGYNVLTLAAGVVHESNIGVGFSMNIPVDSQCDFKVNYGEDEFGDSQFWEYEVDYSGMFFTIAGSYWFRDIAAVTLRVRPGFELGYNYTAVNASGQKYRSDRTVRMPVEYALAISGEPVSRLQLFAEYHTRNMSKYEIETDISTTDLWEKVNNGYVLRFGAEYDYILQYRLGFYAQSVPEFEYETNGVDRKSTLEKGFTAGVGIPVYKGATADIWGCYATNESESDYYDSFYEEPMHIEQQNTRIRFGVTLGYGF